MDHAYVKVSFGKLASIELLKLLVFFMTRIRAMCSRLVGLSLYRDGTAVDDGLVRLDC